MSVPFFLALEYTVYVLFTADGVIMMDRDLFTVAFPLDEVALNNISVKSGTNLLSIIFVIHFLLK